MITLLGKILPGKRDRLEQWMINLNNSLAMAEFPGEPKKLLLLLPHCLQNDECAHRLTKNVLNCAGCGKCNVADLVKMTKKYSIITKVATGGRLATRWVREIKPDLILAIACEKELTEGISAVYPFRVIGITNARPAGPCVNTAVETKKVEDYFIRFSAER